MWPLRLAHERPCTFIRLSWNILSQVFPHGMLSSRNPVATPGFMEKPRVCFRSIVLPCPDFESFRPGLWVEKPQDNSSVQLSKQLHTTPIPSTGPSSGPRHREQRRAFPMAALSEFLALRIMRCEKWLLPHTSQFGMVCYAALDHWRRMPCSPFGFCAPLCRRGPEKCCLCLWAHSDSALPLHPTAQVSLLDKAFSYWSPSSVIWKPRSLPTCRCPLDLSYFFSRLLSPNILQHACAHTPLVGTVHQFSKWSQIIISPSYPQSIDDLPTSI